MLFKCLVFLLFLSKLRLELLAVAQDLFTILPEFGVACSTFCHQQQRGGMSGIVVPVLPVSLHGSFDFISIMHQRKSRKRKVLNSHGYPEHCSNAAQVGIPAGCPCHSTWHFVSC